MRPLSLPEATIPSLWFRVLQTDEINRFRGLAVYVRDDFSAFRQRGYKCGCCEVLLVRICSRDHNFYVFGVYGNPDLSDKIFGCLLTAMVKAQSVDRKAAFLFIGNVNVHHEEWLGFSTTNLQGRTAHDFASSSGCEQMVTEPTHIDEGVLDLGLTDVPVVVAVGVESPVGTSDRSPVFIVFIDVVLEQPIPHQV